MLCYSGSFFSCPFALFVNVSFFSLCLHGKSVIIAAIFDHLFGCLLYCLALGLYTPFSVNFDESE